MSADAENQAGAELLQWQPTPLETKWNSVNWHEGLLRPAIGSVCEISGANTDRTCDQDRAFSEVTVIGYSTCGQFIAVQKAGCWPVVERLTNCWFRPQFISELDACRRAPAPVAAPVPGERAREAAKEIWMALQHGKLIGSNPPPEEIIAAILSRHLPASPDTLALQKEIIRLKRGDFTPEEFQNLCHHRDEKPGCTAEDFFAGCKAYQQKLFGRSDAQPEALAALRAAEGALDACEQLMRGIGLQDKTRTGHECRRLQPQTETALALVRAARVKLEEKQ